MTFSCLERRRFALLTRPSVNLSSLPLVFFLGLIAVFFLRVWIWIFLIKTSKPVDWRHESDFLRSVLKWRLALTLSGVNFKISRSRGDFYLRFGCRRQRLMWWKPRYKLSRSICWKKSGSRRVEAVRTGLNNRLRANYLKKKFVSSVSSKQTKTVTARELLLAITLHLHPADKFSFLGTFHLQQVL